LTTSNKDTGYGINQWAKNEHIKLCKKQNGSEELAIGFGLGTSMT
jgi:hypothetical protein